MRRNRTDYTVVAKAIDTVQSLPMRRLGDARHTQAKLLKKKIFNSVYILKRIWVDGYIYSEEVVN